MTGTLQPKVFIPPWDFDIEHKIECWEDCGCAGEKHSGLLIVSGVPGPGSSLDSLANMLQEQLDRVALDGVTAQELSRVKKATRKQLLNAAQSNPSMASTLAAYHARTGSWRGLLTELEVVQDLTAEDLRQAAQRTFDRSNCFKGFALAA